MKLRTSLGVLALLLGGCLLAWAGFYVSQSYEGNAAAIASQGSFGVVDQGRLECGSALLIFVARPTTVDHTNGAFQDAARGCMPEAHHRVYLASGVAIAAFACALAVVFALFRSKRADGQILAAPVAANPDRRRRWSAWLSVAAASVTGTLMVWSISRSGGHTASWLRWLFSIGLPPITMSLVAAFQYRWGRSNGAGAAAAVLYWALSAVFLMGALALYLFGGILQTVAWYLSRPRRRAKDLTPSADAVFG